ncbi:MAG: M48 family metallopeptidase [Alphaproteobacteria bacterium]|nr:M48 family metallopeptidase [Alphaproteobacteria bacterium]
MKPLIKKLLRSAPAALPELADYVELRRSKRAKRLGLRLDTKKRLFILTVPKGMPLHRAYNFAIEHEEWMEQKLAELPAPIKLRHGLRVPLFGTMHTIKIQYDKHAKRTDITLAGGILLVRTNKEDPSARIIRFLRQEARERLYALSQEKAAQIGKKIKGVAVRDTKSRWGSCSADGNLSYSWRLVFAPYESFDYVVAHEVAHLKHLNHGKKFWMLCEELSEDYDTGHSWMKKNSYELMRYC